MLELLTGKGVMSCRWNVAPSAVCILRGLERMEIGKRQNLKNRRVEMLVVNYEVGRELRLF